MLQYIVNIDLLCVWGWVGVCMCFRYSGCVCVCLGWCCVMDLRGL